MPDTTWKSYARNRNNTVDQMCRFLGCLGNPLEKYSEISVTGPELIGCIASHRMVTTGPVIVNYFITMFAHDT